MSFEKDGYAILKGAISKDVCKVMAREFKIARQLAYAAQHPTENNMFPFHDEMVDRSFSWYSPLCFEALSDSLIKEIVEKELGESVFPTYSYARIYSHNAEMTRHTDRSASEFSVSVCIEVDETVKPWPIYFEDKQGNVLEMQQQPGDAVMYRGHELPHWRNPYHGNEQINAFMFYVRANGPRADLKYDTRSLLGLNSSTRRLTSEQQWAIYNAK
jgi:hypothetical protein